MKDMVWILGMLEEEVNEGVKKEDPNDANEVEVELLERMWGGSWECWRMKLMRASRKKILMMSMRMLINQKMHLLIKVYNVNDL